MVTTRSQTRAARNEQQDEQPAPAQPPSPRRVRRRVRKRRRSEKEETKEIARPKKRQRNTKPKENKKVATTFYNKMMVELNCPVCTELVSGPVTLRCGHTYCYICLCRHIDARYPEAMCPLCRWTIPRDYDPKVSVFLQNVLEGLFNSCLFEGTADKSSYRRRTDEYLSFKLDREANPPSRLCQCHSCRQERGERIGVPGTNAYANFFGLRQRFGALMDYDDDDEEDDEEQGENYQRIRDMFEDVSDGSVPPISVQPARIVNLMSSDDEILPNPDNEQEGDAETSASEQAESRYPLRNTTARRRRAR